MTDNIIRLVPGQSDDLSDLVETGFIRLLREMNDGTEGEEGVGGLSIAERTKILTAATDFLLKREKFSPPEKAPSGLDRLRAGIARSNSRRTTRRRRDIADTDPDAS